MDAREIERCIDEFGTDIYRFCLKLCMDQTDAEDLYQQTFLKALETTWTLDWEQNPRALFFSLAHNLWRSDRRKMARRNRIAPCGHLDEKVQETLRDDSGASGKNPGAAYLVLSFGLLYRADSGNYKKAAWNREKQVV